jgi:hypothetical protein
MNAIIDELFCTQTTILAMQQITPTPIQTQTKAKDKHQATNNKQTAS